MSPLKVFVNPKSSFTIAWRISIFRLTSNASIISLGLAFTLLLAPSLAWSTDRNDIQAQIREALNTIKNENIFENLNKPQPQLGISIENARIFLENHSAYKVRARTDLAFKALWIQTINHLQHVSFTFEREDVDYTHKELFEGQYPRLPAVHALKKTLDFFKFIDPVSQFDRLDRTAEEPKLERDLLDAQQNLAKSIVNNSIDSYIEYRDPSDS